MPLTFTIALSQQSFELRFGNQIRVLQPAELIALIDQCESTYYAVMPGADDAPEDLVKLGRSLYQWLDGAEGWLRGAFGTAQTMAFHLTYNPEIQNLNSDTQRITLGLAHLPWELLHDGLGFLMQRQLLIMSPMRMVQHCETAVEVQNRPLHLLFMATSPEGINPVLNYEQEETNILQATGEQPLLLVTEESGSVQELGNLVRSQQDDYFDVFHLTGHGIIYTEADYGWAVNRMAIAPRLAENTPCFTTENEVGELQLTTVADLAEAFGDRFPRLIFLSGCHTAQVPDRGSVPSMAQALVKAGAQMVLGWARPVYDRTGIVAARALYQALAASESVERALQRAIRAMIVAECPDWHLLRVYGDSRQLGALVTPTRTRGREPFKPLREGEDFLDAQGLRKFEGQFIGRRRSLQRCLRALKPTSDRIGVFIQGMGGLGKSRLAARLCRRVQAQRQNMQRVVLIGVLDESSLLRVLGNQYDQFPGIREALNQPGVWLKGRLKNFFEAIEEELDRPLLLVLDDFEQNIPESAVLDRSLRPISEAVKVLTALCGALEETEAVSRLMITCRYECPLPSRRLHLENNLDRMKATDIDKKCRSLTAYAQVKQHPEYERVLRVADGNPRLLEWLLKLIEAPDVDTAALLSDLEQAELKFREDILAETLVNALTIDEQQFLAKLSVFELPITQEILDGVADGAALPKPLALGLVESPLRPDQAREYRVTLILQPLLQQVLTEAEWLETWRQAAQGLYRVWWEEAESSTEAQGLEIVRLGLLGQEQEIAVTVGVVLANRWYDSARFVEDLELCQSILSVFTDYRIFGSIARAEAVLGFVDESVGHYQQALDLCPENDLKAATLSNMALVIAQQGDIDRALDLWQQSLEIKERIGDVKGKAATLNNMAGVIAQQGEIDRALDLWQQDLEISERIGDVQGKAATLSNMAGVIAQQGDIDRALDLWQQSLEIQERIGDVKDKAATLSNMAGVIAQQGDIDRALDLWQQSLEIQERIGDVQGKSATLNNMALVIKNKGEIDRALDLWQQSLEIKERIGDVQGKAATLSNMAGVIAQQGDIDRALDLWQQDLEISERIGDVKGKATTLNNMAGVIADQGEIDRALDLWQQSLEIQERIGDVQGKAATLNNMARVIAQQGEIDRALDLWQQDLEISERIGDVKGRAATLANMAYWAGETGDRPRQLELNVRSAQALGQVRAYSDLVIVLRNLGETAEDNRLVYLAQAIWLSLKIQVPLEKSINCIAALFNAVPQGDELEALLATTAYFLCLQRGTNHPQLTQLQERSTKMLMAAANAQGIAPEAVEAWMAQQQLNDPAVFLPRLNQRLEALVGTSWLFDRSGFSA